ncbi:hypothetical protein C9374_012583 [Naegleria lovaniensis]|uniref:Uncharacterized protein n=1 Tax=Naegleria lovaniensis TaxID=51637 RepID=A0AA88KQC3_NAELO|nr:uncharacterized protein C9374_012583 [Naegleria lovaniensis]KAG2392331.1 hypothetical protein C9374_012583 [Naegleria lovaniensis]
MQILKPIPERSSSTNEPTFMHGGGTYLLMSSNWSSWVYSGYEGSISSDKDPNKTQSSHKSQFRHVKFYSKQIFDEVNRIGISKIAGGDNHMFLLLNNGDAFGYGWNEYTQLLTSTVKNIDTDSCDQFMKCHLHQIQDIYCGANFSYALVKENSQEFQMYSAGWNNDRCLCHGVNGDGSSRPLGKVYCSDENNQVMLFPPSHEHVLSVSCAGCSVAALTVHRLNPKKKKVYRCGAFTGFPRPNTEHSTYGCLNFTTVKNVEILSGAVSIALCSGSIVVLCEDLSAFILGKEIKLSIPIRKAFQLETSCVYMTEDYKIYNCVNVNSIDTSKDVKWSEPNSNSELNGSQFETLHARGSRAIGVLSDTFDAIIYDQMDQSQFERVSLLEMLSADDQFRLLRSKSLEMQVVCCRSCSFVFIKPIKKSDPMRRKLLLQTQTLDNPFVDVVIVWN